MKEILCENCGRVVIVLAAGSRIMTGLAIWSCPKCDDDTSKRYQDADSDDPIDAFKKMFGMK